MSQVNVDRIKSRAGTGSPTFTNGLICSGVGTFSSHVSIAGTLTYEDVTNVDSVGIVTARAGVRVTAGGINVTAGITTLPADGILVGTGSSIFQPASNTLTLGTNSAERLRIDSSGRFLIGTTTEGEPSVDNLTVGSSGDTGITIRSGTSNNGAITFSDGTSGADEYRGMMDYDHATDFLRFYTNATEKLRIHSNGAVTKAKSPAFGAHGPNVWQTVTHSSSAVTMLFDTEFYDAGANFNTSTYRFTAPVDGAYQFHISVYFKMNDATDASSYATIRWNKNGSSDNQGYRLLMYGNHGKSDNNHTDMMVFALSANDYVTVTLESEDQDVKYYPGHSVFSGFLIG